MGGHRGRSSVKNGLWNGRMCGNTGQRQIDGKRQYLGKRDGTGSMCRSDRGGGAPSEGTYHEREKIK